MAEHNRVKIVGYMHVCMINHWVDILTNQIKIIKDSGLYERVDEIKICAVGCKDEYGKLTSFVDNKIHIWGYSENLLAYEYITLSLLQEDMSKFDAYCFYVHTKGCSCLNNEGGKYWLDYMNYYNLELWRDAVSCLDLGYETYGVKLLTSRDKPAYSMHYSGNFFWTKSSYVNTLININNLNKTNRGNAEMWLCSNQPIAATACQEFIDYDTKGIFKPFKIKSNI